MAGIRFLLVILAITAWFAPAASADPVEVGSRLCTLVGQGYITPEAALAQRGAFDCSDQKFNHPAGHYWAIADIGDLTEVTTEPVLRFRIARSGAITLHAIYDNTPPRTVTYTAADIEANWRAPSYLAIPLTGPTGEVPVTVLLGIERPWDPWNLADTYVVGAEEDIVLHRESRFFNAVFCGLLFAPLLLNAVFFAALRYRFILFHTAMVGSMVITQLLWGGLAFELVPALDMVSRSVLVHLAIAVMSRSACMLVRDVCDPKKLGPFLRLWLKRIAVVPVAVTVAVMLISPGLPVVGSILFHLSILIGLLAVLVSLNYAAWRGGDRIAMAILFGSSGFVIVAGSRIVKALGIIPNAPSFDHGMYFAIFLEALVMSCIVGYKAFGVRHERDVAVSESALLFEKATTDFLTGLLNREAIIEVFEGLVSSPERRRQARAMLVIDIDHFKSINDHHGHQGGDICLKQMGEILKAACREGDHCARIGGEEFIVLLATPTPEDAEKFAERLRVTVEKYEFGKMRQMMGGLTISIGLMHLPRAMAVTFDVAFKAADAALYAAKAAGRNQVKVANAPRGSGKYSAARLRNLANG